MKKIFALLSLLALLVACDDESSSSAPNPIGEISSSSDDDNGSASSSSQKDSKKSSSSVTEKNSSSSVSSKNSSSSVVKSSSSFSIVDWHIPCEGGSGIWEIDDEKYVCEEGFLVPYIPPTSSSSSSAKTYPYKDKFKIDSVFNEEKTYGSFEDPRDGQIYRTIVIKTKYEQFEVFAQNLNYGIQVKLETTAFDDNKVEKFCYDDDSWYCEHYFGGLYTWSETMGLPKACDSVWTGTTSNCPDSIAKGIVYDSDWNKLQIQGVCPDGWHVMNETEWRAMIRGEESAYRSISIASEGVNSNGFSALLGGACGTGFHDFEEFVFYGQSDHAYFWLSKETSENRASGFLISDIQRLDFVQGKRPKVNGHYVRCVKDYTSIYVD